MFWKGRERGGASSSGPGASPPQLCAVECGRASDGKLGGAPPAAAKAGAIKRRGRAASRQLARASFQFGGEVDGECHGVPTLVRRREPVWISANRALGRRLAVLSERLASISGAQQKGRGQQASANDGAAGGVTQSKLGDPVLASIPESDLIARRLKDVPVYTVTSNENFVLLQEEESSQKDKGAAPKSMLMLFMSANDAKNFKDDVVDKQTMLKPIIGTLFMDKVFKLHMQARPKELENVALRLMPDRKQVAHAFEAYNESGVGNGGHGGANAKPLRALPGVPVFQAEGLTMRSGDKTMIPLFFGKEELDFALEQAFGKDKLPVTPAVAYKRQWFARQKERVKEVAKSPFPFLYQSIWKEDDDKAKQRLKELENKQQALVAKQPSVSRPRVQVGSFEDVLFRMLYEKGKEWDNVMFIPQGVSLVTK